MGLVWRAHDRMLDRKVAVKEVMLSAAIDEYEIEDLYQRTQREARTAARLSHPGIVTVHDVAEEDGRLWIVMELVPSRSLDKILAARGPLTAPRAGRIGQQLLAALAAAHAAGVLHRDVKPSNVLIAPDGSSDGEDERAVLTDFGIAQFEGDSPLTQTGLVMGTPGFIAPERLVGEVATPASDLWSLGATLYAAVEGHGPFERDSVTTTLAAIVHEAPPPAQSAGRLAPLIAALLRREPSARPTASAAARMFAEIMARMPAENAPASSAAGTPPDPIHAETAISAKIAEPVERASQRREDAQHSGLPAPGPFTPLGAPTHTFVPLPPQAADHLLQQLGAGAGVGSRRSSLRGRRIALMTAGTVLIAAFGTAGFLLSQRLSGQGSSPRESLSPAAATSLPPISGETPGVVLAIDRPNRTLPAGYKTETVSPSAVAKTAGFSIDVPRGWQSNAMGQQTYQYTPDNVTYVEIDLSRHAMTNMVSEADYLERQTRTQYPGYQPVYTPPGKPQKKYIQAEDILNTAGAFWQFDWVDNRIKMRVDILLFNLGHQSFTIKMTAPAGHHDNNWNLNTIKTVSAMLRTFKAIPY